MVNPFSLARSTAADTLLDGALPIAPQPRMFSRGLLVVADDDIATRMLLCRVLTRASYTVYTVENGAQACEAVQLLQPDLVLLDWTMPVMDGRSAAALLKADPRTHEIPIIMLTTHAGGEDRISALAAGIQDYLTKPFEAGELVNRIERQLRGVDGGPLTLQPVR